MTEFEKESEVTSYTDIEDECAFSKSTHETNVDIDSGIRLADSEILSVPEIENDDKTNQTINTDAGQPYVTEEEITKETDGEHEDKTEPGYTLDREDFEHPFSEQTWREDLTLIVEGRKLYVSKAILAVCSPVFNKMFEECPIQTLEIEHTTFNAMLEFLCCLYPHIRKPVTVNTIQLVMNLAGRYQVQTLINKCEDLVRKKAVATTTCNALLSMLAFCQEMGLKGLEDQCIRALANKPLYELREVHLHDDDRYASTARDIYRLKAEKLTAKHGLVENESDEDYDY